MPTKEINNTILFCERPWRVPAAILAFLVFITFGWGFYLVDEISEVEIDDFSISDMFVRSANTGDTNLLYNMVPPAVVGISGGGINAGTVASGAIVSANGYVVTTLHSVNNLNDIKVQVRTQTGVQSYDAQIVKSVAAHDIAMLKMVTNDRFLFLRLADTNLTNANTIGGELFAFGNGSTGNAIVKQGSLLDSNVTLTSASGKLDSLWGTNAVYTWEQAGGPLVNAKGEFVGMNLPLQGVKGAVDGYAIPANVIIKHFQDVVTFKLGGKAFSQKAPQKNGQAIVAPVAAPAAGAGSSAWWQNAAMQVKTATPTTAPNTSPSSMNPVGVIHSQLDHVFTENIAGFPVEELLGLALLSLVAGIAGGMMTMGGGVIQVAGMMAIYGYGIYLVRPVGYLTNIFVYGAAAWRNNKADLISWEKVKSLLPWAVIGVVVGYFIGNSVGDRGVAIMLGLFALLMAAKAIHELSTDRDNLSEGEVVKSATSSEMDDLINENPAASSANIEYKTLDSLRKEYNTWGDKMKNALLGTPMGLISGIMGISGGVIEVPMQRYFSGISLKNAIANSSVLVFAASISGAMVAFVHGLGTGLIDWQAPLTLSAVMIPGAFAGGYIGSKLLDVLPLNVLKLVYIMMMLAVAVKMLIG